MNLSRLLVEAPRLWYDLLSWETRPFHLSNSSSAGRICQSWWLPASLVALRRTRSPECCVVCVSFTCCWWKQLQGEVPAPNFSFEYVWKFARLGGPTPPVFLPKNFTHLQKVQVKAQIFASKIVKDNLLCAFLRMFSVRITQLHEHCFDTPLQKLLANLIVQRSSAWQQPRMFVHR